MIRGVQGLSKIQAKKTKGDEWGVYRLNEDGQPFLLFAFDDVFVAADFGKKLSKLLKVRFEDRTLYDQNRIKHEGSREKKVSEKSTSVTSNRPARVKGAVDFCRELLLEGKSDSEVKKIVTEKYTDAGHLEAKAADLALGVFYEAKRQVKKDLYNE